MITSYYRCVGLVLIVTGAVTVALGDDTCPAVIEALRNEYHFSETDSVTKIVKNLVCHPERSGLSITAEDTVTGEHQSPACSDTSDSYWQNHAKEISIHYLPPALAPTVLSLCNNTSQHLSLDVVENGKMIVLSTTWTRAKATPNSVKIRGFTYEPKIVSCDLSIFKSRMYANANPIPIMCKRLTDDDAMFTIRADEDFAIARAPSTKPVYKLRFYGVDDQLFCTIQHGANNVIDQEYPILSKPAMTGITDPVFKNPKVEDTVDLTIHLKEGDNFVNCRVVNLYNAPGHITWSYHYDITENGQVFADRHDVCLDCGYDAPKNLSDKIVIHTVVDSSIKQQPTSKVRKGRPANYDVPQAHK